MERERSVTQEVQAKTILDSLPFNQKIKDFGYKAFSQSYFKLSEIADPEFLKSKFRLFITAMHEIGHAKVARALGWTVTKISVIPKGNTLGVTQFIPNINSKEKLLSGMIAISIGGEVGQNLADNVGDRGCGSDKAQSRNHESVLNITSHFDPGISGVKSWGRRQASSNLAEMEDEALYLMYIGEKAA